MNTQEIVTLMASGGGGAALLALIQGSIKWLSGASTRERLRNSSLLSQRNQAVKDRDEAEGERDNADKKRREAEEHVSMLKRQLLEAGYKPVERTDDT